jgi:hypothetical protein
MMASPSISNILTTLPLEVHHQIYILILTSPNGFIKILSDISRQIPNLDSLPSFVPTPSYPAHYSSWRFTLPTNLSFIRTCKQLYQETLGIFWKVNTLVLEPLPTGFLEAHPMLRSLPIVHVRLDIDISSNQTWQTEQTLKLTTRWVREGRLRSVTLYLTTDIIDLASTQLSHPYDGRSMLFREYRGLLRRAGNGYVKSVERKMVLETRWEDMDAQEQAMVFRRTNGSGVSKLRYRELWHTVRDLHKAFGGELWQDGKLCFKDHEQVAQVFESKAASSR